MLVFVGLQAVRTPNAAWRNRRQLSYDPVVQFLRARVDPKALTMGDAGLLYGLGADWNLLDDSRLGYNSGKRADVVVINPTWEDAHHDAADQRARDPRRTCGSCWHPSTARCTTREGTVCWFTKNETHDSRNAG